MHIPARRCQVFRPGKRRKLHNGALKASPSALMFLEDDHVRTSVRAKRRMILGTRPTSHPSIPLIFQGSASVEMSGLSIDACKDDDEDQRDSEREIGSIGGQPGSVPSSVASLPVHMTRPFQTPDLGDQVDNKLFLMSTIMVQMTSSFSMFVEWAI